MVFARGTTAKAVLFFVALIFLFSDRALAEGVDLENTQVITATPSVLRESLLSKDARCARVPISGLSRLKLGSYSSAHRITLTPSDEIQERSHKKIQICSHRNTSLALCQCKSGEWVHIQNGMWSSIISPYEDRYLDVKFVENLSGSVKVDVNLEFHIWRIFCLFVGLFLLFLAPTISSWLPFYYSFSMATGIFLVVIVLLFQGGKLLPLGRKNILYSSIFGLVVGAGTYLLNGFSAFVTSILFNLGISEEFHHPVLLFWSVILVLVGAGFGYWGVQKFVVAEDESVKVGIAHFLKWALRAIGVTLIYLSTLDTPLGISLLACLTGILYSLDSIASVTWHCGRFYSGSMRALCRSSSRVNGSNKRAEFLKRNVATNSRERLWRGPMNSSSWANSPVRGVVSPSGPTTSSRTSTRDFYSTYHKIQNRKKLSRKEWRDLTEESTRQAVAELASSPEFVDWVIKHADRIQINQDDSSSDEESSAESGSDESATQSSSGGRGLLSFW